MTKHPHDPLSRFDRNASTWDDNPLRRNMARAVAEKIIQTVIKPDKPVDALEIGSGTGLVTAYIAPFVKTLTALDGSENMLAELGKKLKDHAIENVTLSQKDLVTEDIPGNMYGLIFTNMTFHHIKDGDKLLKKIFNALTSGGILALSDLDTEDGTFHSDMEGVHHLGFDRVEILSAFERAGFMNCSIDEAHKMEKKNAHGVLSTFSLFLATGEKP